MMGPIGVLMDRRQDPARTELPQGMDGDAVKLLG